MGNIALLCSHVEKWSQELEWGNIIFLISTLLAQYDCIIINFDRLINTVD